MGNFSAHQMPKLLHSTHSNQENDKGRAKRGEGRGGRRTQLACSGMKRRGGSGGGGHGAAGGASSRRDGGGHDRDRDGHGHDGDGKLRIHLKRSCTDRKLVEPQGGTELGLTTDGEGAYAHRGLVAQQGHSAASVLSG